VWANPYQPGLVTTTWPLAQHMPSGASCSYVPSGRDDASWIGFFDGQLQLFRPMAAVTRIDPKLAHEPMDIEEATGFLRARREEFRVPKHSPRGPATGKIRWMPAWTSLS